MSSRLVLIRHGQSTWNLKNLFTGWYDADLTDQGVAEAVRGGQDLLAARVAPDVVHTSVQVRAIRTANLVLDELDRLWIPVRRSWRLNERHYGELTGKDKAQTTAEHGEEKVHRWRRSYDEPPPPIRDDNVFNPNSDERYAALPPDVVPSSECLKDVVERMLPWWYDGICPDLGAGRTVLVVAHGNSLRALVKHLDGISDDDIAELNLPTGVPFVYDLDDDFTPADPRPLFDRAVGDVEAAKAAAQKVADQAKAKTV